jgi:hypothetical protein
MPNPTLDQITRNAVLLENEDSSVPESMSCPDRNSNLLAEWLQNIAIHIPIDQWSSVSALEDSARYTIANIRFSNFTAACSSLKCIGPDDSPPSKIRRNAKFTRLCKSVQKL